MNKKSLRFGRLCSERKHKECHDTPVLLAVLAPRTALTLIFTMEKEKKH